MGFMDISIVGSDTASELNAKVKKHRRHKAKVLGFLQKELRKDHGQWNTPGCINVALVLVEGEARQIFEGCKMSGYRSLVTDTHKIMKKVTKAMDDAAWDEEAVERCQELTQELGKL